MKTLNKRLFKNQFVINSCIFCFVIFGVEIAEGIILENKWKEELSTIQNQLEKGYDINQKDESNETLLHEASWSGNIELVKFLVEKGADINAQNSELKTPLHIASYKGNLEIAKFLIEKKVNINALDKNQRTPLRRAIGKNNLLMAKLLLENGANINLGKEPKSLFVPAVRKGNLEMVKLLLQYDQGQKIFENTKNDLLHGASKKNHQDTVKFLVEKGADVNFQSARNKVTPLSLAVKSGNKDIVKYLLDAGDLPPEN